MQDFEFWMKVGVAVYYIVGLPIAWWHMHREKVAARDLPDTQRVRTYLWVIFLLAALWPVLLLAFGAAWVANRLDGPAGKK